MEGNSSNQENSQLNNQNFENYLENGISLDKSENKKEIGQEEDKEIDKKDDDEDGEEEDSEEDEDENFNTIKELHEVAKESINLIRSNSKNRLSGLEIAAFIIPILAFYFLYSKISQSPQL